MAVGIGIRAVDDGNGGLIGRSPLDDRLLVRSDYHNLGIVMGCDVVTSSSGMTYQVTNGSDPVSVAVGSRSGADGATKFVVPTGSVGTSAAPASGARVDRVWARQLDPDKDGPTNNQSIVGISQGAASASPVEPSIPAGAVELAVFQVPQGATRTSQATKIRDGAHAIPYGASLGILHRHHDTSTSTLPTVVTYRGAGSIFLPTPRTIEFAIRPTISSATAVDGSAYYGIDINGTTVARFEAEAEQRWLTQYLVWTQVLPAGRHTVRYWEMGKTGPAVVKRSSDWFPGTTFIVKDEGVA